MSTLNLKGQIFFSKDECSSPTTITWKIHQTLQGKALKNLSYIKTTAGEPTEGKFSVGHKKVNQKTFLAKAPN